MRSLDFYKESLHKSFYAGYENNPSELEKSRPQIVDAIKLYSQFFEEAYLKVNGDVTESLVVREFSDFMFRITGVHYNTPKINHSPLGWGSYLGALWNDEPESIEVEVNDAGFQRSSFCKGESFDFYILYLINHEFTHVVEHALRDGLVKNLQS
jgi:hypothetical protein